MDLGLFLVLGGIVIAVCSFIYALVNMGRTVDNVFSGTALEGPGLVGAFFKRHLGAIAGMAVGGALIAVGLVLLAARHYGH